MQPVFAYFLFRHFLKTSGVRGGRGMGGVRENESQVEGFLSLGQLRSVSKGVTSFTAE